MVQSIRSQFHYHSLQSMIYGFSLYLQLETITLFKVSPKFIGSILTTFGTELIHLTFIACEQINLPILAPCQRLESLRIHSSNSSLIDVEETKLTELNKRTFLPTLKSFESHICLGVLSRLFEEKSTILHLVLNCCHIGTEV